MMVEKKRTISAITHNKTEPIPYMIEFTASGHENMATYFADNEFYSKIGNHINLIKYSSLIGASSDIFIDYFGVEWNRSGSSANDFTVSGCVIPEPVLKGFTLPKFDEAQLRILIEKNLGRFPEKFNLFTIGISLFERACALCGTKNILNYMIMESKFVDRLFVMLCEYNIRLVDIALEYDIDGIYFLDDWCQNDEMMIENVHWRKYIKPQLQRMYERVKRKGKFVFHHSNGDLQDVFPDLVEIGLDVYHPFKPEIYGIGKIKEEYGNVLSFWGGISNKQLELFTDSNKIYKMTRNTIELLSKDGGFIIAPTNPISSNVPISNVIAMLKAINHASVNEKSSINLQLFDKIKRL